MPETPQDNASTPHIRWQEVIELDHTMPEDDRAKLAAALEKLEDSDVGQKKFDELAKLQALMPPTIFKVLVPAEAKELKRKEQQEKYPFLKNMIIEREKNHDKDVRQAREINSYLYHQQEAPKLFISTVSANGNSGIMLQEIMDGGGGGYEMDRNLMLFHLPTTETVAFPKQTESGKKLAPAPLDETISHEIQHAINDRRSKWLHRYPLTRPCLEQRADETENAFVAEKHPAEPLRYAYADMKLQIQTDPRVESILNQLEIKDLRELNKPQFKIQLGLVAEILGHGVVLDAGCSGISPQKILAETRRTMHELGLRTDTLSFFNPSKPSPEMQPETAKEPAQQAMPLSTTLEVPKGSLGTMNPNLPHTLSPASKDGKNPGFIPRG